MLLSGFDAQEVYYFPIEQVLRTAFCDPIAWDAHAKGQEPGPGQFCSSPLADRLRSMTRAKAFSPDVIMVQIAFDECRANASGPQKMGLLVLRYGTTMVPRLVAVPVKNNGILQ
jgi:hypothetical protein